MSYSSLFADANQYQARIRKVVQCLADEGDATGLLIAINDLSTNHYAREGMKSDLFGKVHRLLHRFPESLMNGSDPVSVPVRVDFLAVCKNAVDTFPEMDQKAVGNYMVIIVPGRLDRPQGETESVKRHNRESFNEKGFHYDLPRLKREIIFSGEIEGVQTDAFVQKYPFARGHTILCPLLKDHDELFLTGEKHEWHSKIMRASRIPTLRLGRNSLGAYGSVNHDHTHAFLVERPLQVENPRLKINGGQEEYPAQVMAFDIDSVKESRAYLDFLNSTDLAYNVLYSPSKCYFFPRQKQGSFTLAPWTTGFAFMEMAGCIIVSRRFDYDALSVEEIECEYAKLRL